MIIFIFVFTTRQIPIMLVWWKDQSFALVCHALLYVDLIHFFTPRQVWQKMFIDLVPNINMLSYFFCFKFLESTPFNFYSVILQSHQ